MTPLDHREEIMALLAEYDFPRQGRLDLSDIFIGNGLEGDDADEFMRDFAGRTGVDMAEFRSYFHYVGDEPPGRRRVLPIAPDGHVNPFIPVTLDDLLAAAKAGHWLMEYPAHTVRTSLRSRVVRIGTTAMLVAFIAAYVWSRTRVH